MLLPLSASEPSSSHVEVLPSTGPKRVARRVTGARRGVRKAQSQLVPGAHGQGNKYHQREAQAGTISHMWHHNLLARGEVRCNSGPYRAPRVAGGIRRPQRSLRDRKTKIYDVERTYVHDRLLIAGGANWRLENANGHTAIDQENDLAAVCMSTPYVPCTFVPCTGYHVAAVLAMLYACLEVYDHRAFVSPG